MFGVLCMTSQQHCKYAESQLCNVFHAINEHTIHIMRAYCIMVG